MVFPTAVPSVLQHQAPDDVPDELKAVWEVWALLTSEHVDRAQFDPKVFTEAAIRGLITALDDQHTGYVPPESFQIENDDIYGRFEGIGANVTMRRDGKLQIVAPLKGSPAEKAGLKSGDVVVAVNGEDIAGLSLLEAVSRIRGPRGTEVRLVVLHLGAVDEVEISIVRDVIPLESVLVRSRPEDRFAHIRLSTFYADTADQLAEAISQAKSDGAEGLVLDVRNNPGGLLDAVLYVTGLFIEDGLALYQIDGSGRRRNNEVRGDAKFAELPMVLLANSFSASASEILVGAFQDHARAPVIGDKTFGKGSVNILRRLENEGGLYLTLARWFTPNGRLIEGEGLDPDYEVTSRDAQKADIDQLNKAKEVLSELVEADRSS
ncbi:S41 family peptidase [Dehalococcoidia bacterium]|nr:S41 family peptidase [Dehalococcoidia bacterium]